MAGFTSEYLAGINRNPHSRNGYGRKSVSTGTRRIEIAIPRDRAGSFDPELIASVKSAAGD